MCTYTKWRRILSIHLDNTVQNVHILHPADKGMLKWKQQRRKLLLIIRKSAKNEQFKSTMNTRNGCCCCCSAPDVLSPCLRLREGKALKLIEYCHVFEVAWLIITGFGLDDWIYWHFFTITNNYDSSQSVIVYDSLHSLLDHECLLRRITAHTFNSLTTAVWRTSRNWNLLDWTNFQVDRI
jgi:hypothetical protein